MQYFKLYDLISVFPLMYHIMKKVPANLQNFITGVSVDEKYEAVTAK